MLEKFGKYRVICELARGGMGIVYKAEDPVLNRLVAIKQLYIEEVDDDRKVEFRERFRREAILAANLRHLNIVAIYDVEINEESAYYVMELLDGVTLKDELERRPGNKMSVDEFFPIFSQTCKGLSHAREKNLVHRDIKPDNIFILPDGTIKITDFGIACTTDAKKSTLTRPGVFLGTLAYVSPEQLQDAHSVDHRADIYSLAVVAYQALVGEVPFSADGLSSTLLAIVSKEARAANEANPDISPDIAAVIAKGMRKKADERYSSTDEFEKEFERAIGIQRGSSSGAMLRSRSPSGGPFSAYSPGIPLTGGPAQSSGSRPAIPAGGGPAIPPVTPNMRTTAQHAIPKIEDVPKAIKPWLAGRTAEKPKAAAVSANLITRSVPLVKVIGKMGAAGDGQGAFMEPSVICARAGKIVVADSGTRKLQIFGRDGRFQGESFCSPARKLGSKTIGGVFTKPSGLAIDTLGRIYASDSSDQYVRIFDAQGSFLREFVNRQGREGGITGLLCDESGNIYLSDPDNGCVHVVTSDMGAWLRKSGTKGTGDGGQLQSPQGLGLDQFEQLYVVDQGTCRICVFSSTGAFQRSWGGKGKEKGEFTAPRGIAMDQFDRVYVADSLNHRVQVFSAAGDYLYSFGGWGTELGCFTGPSDLSIDPENNHLYVCDKGNCRVQIFEILES